MALTQEALTKARWALATPADKAEGVLAALVGTFEKIKVAPPEERDAESLFEFLKLVAKDAKTVLDELEGHRQVNLVKTCATHRD